MRGVNWDRWLVNIILAVAVIAVWSWNYDQATKAERALCTFRGNIEKRVAAAEEYRDDVNAGRREAIPGITSADISRGINRDNADLLALSNLDCPEVKP